MPPRILHFVFWALRQLTAKGTKDILLGTAEGYAKAREKAMCGGILSKIPSRSSLEVAPTMKKYAPLP